MMPKAFSGFLLGTLRGRLILSVATVHAVVMALFIAGMAARQRAVFVDRQREEALGLSQILAASAARWIAAGDTSNIREIVEAYRLNPEALFVALLDAEGRVLAGTNGPEPGLYLPDQPRELRPRVLSGTTVVVDVAAPVVIGGEHVGWARVGLARTATDRLIAETTRRGVLYGLAAVLLAAGIAWLLGRQVIRRLQAIRMTVAEIRSGDRQARSPVSGTDEVAVIASEVSSMLATLVRSDADLRASEERHRSLIDSVQAAIVLHDGQGRIKDSNPLAQALLGLSSEQLSGRELTDPEWRFLREDGSVLSVGEYPVSRVLSSRQSFRDQVMGIARPDRDDVTWVLVNAEPVTDGAGDLSMVIVSFVDVTERRRIERRLRESEALFRSVVTAMGEGMYLQTATGQVQAQNPAVERITGHSAEELCLANGDPMGRAVHEDGSPFPDHLHPSMVTLRTGVPQEGVVMGIHRPDRSLAWLSVNAQPLVEPGTVTPSAVVTTFRDITRQRLADEALRRANRELQAISKCNQVLVRATDEQVLLNAVCQIVCEEAGYRLAWVGLAEQDDAKTVRPVAWAGVGSEYIAEARLTWAGGDPHGSGPAGKAIRSGEVIVVQDIATDPQMAPWRERALLHGYRSGIALPLKSDDARSFGVLLIYSAEANAVAPAEVRLLEELASDLSYGMVALRSRTAGKRNQDIRQARLELLEYAGSHGMNELLTAALDHLEELTGSTIGFYHFLEPDQVTLSLQSWSTNTLKHMCTAQGKGDHYDIAQAGVWVDCVHQRCPVVHNDYAALPHRKGMPDGHAPVTREVVVPIFRDGQIKAIIGVGNKPTEYDVSDIEVMTRLGDLSWDIAERKKAEEALTEQYSTLKGIISSMNAPVYSVDRDLRYTSFNAAHAAVVKEIYGRRIEIGHHMLDYMTMVEDREAAQAHLNRALAGEPLVKEAYSGEGALARRCFRVTHNPIRDEQDGIIGAAVLAEDITERRRAEEERLTHLWLLESMDQVNRAMQGAKDLEQMMCDVLDAVLAIYACDRAWLVYPCEPEAPSWWVPMERTRPGYPGAFGQGIHFPMNPETLRVFRAVKTSEAPVSFGPGFEQPLPAEIAERFHIESMLAMAIYPKEDSSYVFGLHQCSHPRVWTEAESRLMQEIGRRLADGLTSLSTQRNLKESEEKYRAVVENASDAILVAQDGKVAFVNDQAARLAVCTKEELQSAPFLDFVHPDDRAKVAERHHDRLVGGEIPPVYTFRILGRDQQTRWAEINAVLIAWEGRPATLSFLRDITERRRLEEQIERQRLRALQADRLQALGEITAGVAHELNQPLNGIRTFAEGTLLGIRKGWVLPKDELQETLADIIAQVDRATEIIDHMRIFARDQVQDYPKRFKLEEVVRGALKLIGTQLRSQGVEVQHEIEDGLPVCTGWPNQLEQVVLNLVSNSRDALDARRAASKPSEGGDSGWRPVIQIRAYGDVSCRAVHLEVRDNGGGIPEEAMPRIYEPFFTTKEVGKGTGLGLAIAQGIIARHQGRIEVDNRPGEGVTFTVVLPACLDPAAE